MFATVLLISCYITLGNFENNNVRINLEAPLLACGCCGMKAFEMDDAKHYSVPLSSLALLHCNDVQLAKNMPKNETILRIPITSRNSKTLSLHLYAQPAPPYTPEGLTEGILLRIL
jgi:hypothetical protein